MADPLAPCPIWGEIEDGSNLNLIIRNLRTGDTLTAQCDTTGRYVQDAANFTNGYLIGDTVRVIITDLPQHTENITTSNGDLRLK